MTTNQTKTENDVTHCSLTLVEAAQLNLIEAGKIRFSKTGSRLDMIMEDGKKYEKITIRRAFPLSLPTCYYSARDSDNKEIGILFEIEKLDNESKHILNLELERRYMVAIIRRIIKVTERFGTVDWSVETDRGACLFTTRDLRENAIRMSENHYLITDVENNRFEVPDLNALDQNSQALLIRHL